MSRKSIAQEYFTLVTNEKGMLPTMRRDESNAGIVAAAVMDLLLNGIIDSQNAALIFILHEMKNLNQYFDKHEYSELKKELKDIKKEPKNKHYELQDQKNQGQRVRCIKRFSV